MASLMHFYVREACCESWRCKSSAGCDGRNREPKASVSVARRNLKESWRRNRDPTNRDRIQGWHGGVTRSWTGEPMIIGRLVAVNPTGCQRPAKPGHLGSLENRPLD